LTRTHDLLDMGGLAGAVIAGDDHAAVAREAGQDRERGCAIEQIIRVEIGYVDVRLRIGRHLHVAVDTKNLAHRHFHIGQAGRALIGLL
jgi:hypothetical protein